MRLILAVGVLSSMFLFPSAVAQYRQCLVESEKMPGVRIEGRKWDLFQFTYKGKNYLDPIRDGDNLVCQSFNMGVPTIKFDTEGTRIPGTDFRSYFLPGYEVVRIPGDVVITPSIVAVRHGRKRDLVRAYGIIRDASGSPVGVVPLAHTPRDGEQNSLYPSTNGDIVHRYGRKSDLHTRFCFNGVSWSRSPGNGRDQLEHKSCSEPVAGSPIMFK